MHPLRPSRAPSPCATTLAALLLGLGASASAQAQSYNYTVLKDPAGAVSCGPYGASLSDTGDVLASCDYPRNNLADIFGALLSGYGGPLPSKPVVWRASGTTDVLQGMGYGIQTNGQVIGSVPGLFSNSKWTNVVWTGRTRSTWKPPAGVTGTWDLLLHREGFSRRGGAYVIYKSGVSLATPQLGVVANGVSAAAPTAPTACHISDSNAYKSYAVNNSGTLAVLSRWTTSNAFLPTNDPNRLLGYAQVCKWSSQTGWVVGPAIATMQLGMSTAISTPVELTDITEANEVLIVHEQLGAVSWGSSGGWQARDPRFSYGGANGELLGRDQDRAMILRNGQAIDLNSQVSLPADLVLTRALAINKKGQILCEGTPVPGMGTKRTVVLTPK